ncbi:uncharacterized protein BX663DRAFT_517712 [Cokeromyces recurvatus]|uniref:uncharacterized protein n=1 Tax=Cokeromyces recurvatus TaxID=90255 RepID=UPI002220FBDE|nr:uncharacterized protein BX663DRAFT_517712 [Cokeromyces recurvatus]KAI7900462.1 hypothetical protein BX663DRAFT_517712 [Cokeromyces recurvatus]
MMTTLKEKNYYQLGLSKEELNTLYEAFQLYDTNKKGFIELKQFTDILIQLGISNEQLLHIIQFATINHDNKIDFNVFVLAMLYYLPSSNNTLTEEEEIMACFQYFDQDQDGRISLKELEQVMTRLGTHLTTKELKEMMSVGDINKDGFIDFNEFKQLLPPI